MKKRQEHEILSFKNLLNDAERWKQADILRGFINSIEEILVKRGHVSEEKRNWLLWARKKADWYDPLINSDDEFLSSIDRRYIEIN